MVSLAVAILAAVAVLGVLSTWLGARVLGLAPHWTHLLLTPVARALWAGVAVLLGLAVHPVLGVVAGLAIAFAGHVALVAVMWQVSAPAAAVVAMVVDGVGLLTVVLIAAIGLPLAGAALFAG